MPYHTRESLPKSVHSALQNVPHAQDIYKEAYNNAWERYEDPASRRAGASREETASAIAWKAVKQKYEKGEDGQWHPKS